MNSTRRKRSTVIVLLAALLMQGCAGPGARLQYLIGDKQKLSHYHDYASAIQYPVETEPREMDPNLFRAPRTITSLEDVEQRPILLDECVRIALSNAAILREDQNFGSPSNPLMSSPSRVPSVYDYGIQETGILFGSRGVEAALSDFDPQFTNSIQWGRTEDVQNAGNLGIPRGGVLKADTAQWQARLEKNFANSGSFALEHDWNYAWNNQTNLFPSTYTGLLRAEYRQPLLAGAGTEFTRISGPLAQGIRGVSGVAQGVVISRINGDISLIEFEESVTRLVRDVENKYWDLYLALQLYQSEITTFEDIVYYRELLATRSEAKDAEYQAANRLYEADARMKGSLGDVLNAEYRLRRLLGLPLNDGQFLTPIDKPTEAKLIPSWESSLIESFANRPELRRQKWEVRSLELQLSAARNLSRPRFDFVSQYQVNGFGDKLIAYDDDDGVTDAGYNSAYESMTQGDLTGWNLGLQFSMPLGLRLARAQVRNYELRLRKARSVLDAQEQEIAYELNEAIVKMDQWYLLADTGAKRSDAATGFAEWADVRLKNEEDRRPEAIGRVVDAKINSRDADQQYLRSIVEYNKAITELNFRKGTILQAHSITLAEGQWNPEAYEDVRYRAEAMTHAFDSTQLEALPSEFVAGPGPTAWESQGLPDRPHVPGVVEGLGPSGSEMSSPIPGNVPEVPVLPEGGIIGPAMPDDPKTPRPGTKVPPPPKKDYDATRMEADAPVIKQSSVDSLRDNSPKKSDDIAEPLIRRNATPAGNRSSND